MGEPDLKKRKRNRKARTEVSSSSSSSSSSEDERPSSPAESLSAEQTNSRNSDLSPAKATTEVVDELNSNEPIFNAQMKAKPVDREQQFADFYLRQATKEFADDLEKLRSAPDFDERRSVPILIDALRQGSHCFSIDERKKIGGAASTAAK